MSQSMQSVINELNTVRSSITQPIHARDQDESISSVSFGSVLKSAIDGVNQLSMSANTNVRELERGNHEKSIAGVMASVQEADIAFQEMVQIRNKLVQAYTEMMNMQV